MKRKFVICLFLLVQSVIIFSCQSDDHTPRKDVYVYGGDWTGGPNQNAYYKNNIRTIVNAVGPDNDWGWKQRLNVWNGKVRIVVGDENPVLWIDGVTQTFPEGFIAQFVDFDQEDVYVAGHIDDKLVICKNNQKVLEFFRGNYFMQNFEYSNGEYYTTGHISGGERRAHYTKGDVFHDLSGTKSSSGNVIRVIGSDIYVGGILENRPVIWKNGTPTFLGENTGEVYDLWLVKNTMYASGYVIASGVTTAAYWIDGVETTLQEQVHNSILYSIFITRDKEFYVIGETSVGGGEWRSFVIKDGKLDPSFDSANKFWGASIFIDER